MSIGNCDFGGLGTILWRKRHYFVGETLKVLSDIFVCLKINLKVFVEFITKKREWM